MMIFLDLSGIFASCLMKTSWTKLNTASTEWVQIRKTAINPKHPACSSLWHKIDRNLLKGGADSKYFCLLLMKKHFQNYLTFFYYFIPYHPSRLSVCTSIFIRDIYIFNNILLSNKTGSSLFTHVLLKNDLSYLPQFHNKGGFFNVEHMKLALFEVQTKPTNY